MESSMIEKLEDQGNDKLNMRALIAKVNELVEGYNVTQTENADSRMTAMEQSGQATNAGINRLTKVADASTEAVTAAVAKVENAVETVEEAVDSIKEKK